MIKAALLGSSVWCGHKPGTRKHVSGRREEPRESVWKGDEQPQEAAPRQGWIQKAGREVILGTSKAGLFGNKQSPLRLRRSALLPPNSRATTYSQSLCPTGRSGGFQEQWQVTLDQISPTWSSTLLKVWI